jgi:hypothetical protein
MLHMTVAFPVCSWVAERGMVRASCPAPQIVAG